MGLPHAEGLVAGGALCLLSGAQGKGVSELVHILLGFGFISHIEFRK